MSKHKTLRSNFLIHWTGKKIHKDCSISPNPEHSREYIELLCEILYEGLWIKPIKEKWFVPTLGSEKYSGSPCTCFSEIKLSAVDKHTRLYGCLGFGFTREFIMERYGIPVQYVPGTYKDIISDYTYRLHTVLQNLSTWIDKNPCARSPQHTDTFLSFLHSEEFKGILQSNGYKAEADEPWKIFETLKNQVNTNAIFIKKMSEKTDRQHDFKYLDEAEWRIPAIVSGRPEVDPPIEYLDNEAAKRMYRERTGKEPPTALIKFYPTNLKVLILPGEKTRDLAFKDPRVLKWFKVKDPDSCCLGYKIPVIATVEECLGF